jgi:hypothetical protein
MKRLLAGLVVASLLIAALPAASVAAAGKGGGVSKVTICHVAGDGSQHTITIGAPAVKAHIGKHAGDYRGACTGAGHANTQCTFAAADSLYAFTTPANGPIIFTWRLSDGTVTSGSWNEIYPANSGQVFPSLLTGTVIGNAVSLTVVALNVPLVGTLNGGSFAGHITVSNAQYAFTASGTNTCT